MQRVFRRRRDADVAIWDLVGGEPPEIEQPTGRPRLARVLVIVGVLLALVSGATLIGAKLLVARYAGSVHQERMLGEAAALPPAAGDGRGASRHVPEPLNLLLAGIDERDYDPSMGARADTIIIAHISPSRDRAYLISIPRDSRVEIPAFRKTGYPGGTEKINAAFAFGFYNSGGRAGGFELLALTIKQLTGISFNAGAIINFDGFQGVVDSVGGVDMCVDEETAVVSGPVYHVGCRHFTGAQALEYVSQRKLISDGDYGRQRHQQQLVAAVAKKVGSAGMLTDPLAADRTLRSMGNAVTFDGNGVSLQDWVMTLKDVNPGNMKMIKTNGGKYTTQIIDGLSFEILTGDSRELFTAIRDDTLDAFITAHPDWVSGNAAP
jgi:LCP family protein required for cell wall assembly